jgi:large subunit ribosomal protein L10
MNRDQKAATIEALTAEIRAADAVFAVDYRGISVPQAAELRGKLREADATFRVVKNSLTERAADDAGAEALKELLAGPTALTFVHGDAALAAKAIADYARATQLLPFKGGIMNGDTVDAEQIRAISRLPARDVLYGQLVGLVASPVTGLVRTLNALVSGLAVALGQVREKKESGELPAGDPPAGMAAAAEAGAAEAEAPAGEAEAPAAEAEAEAPAGEAEAPAAEAPAAEAEAEAPAAEAPAAEAEAEAPAAEEAPAPEEAPEETPAAEEAPAEPADAGESEAAAEAPAEAVEETPPSDEAPAEAAQAPAEPAADAPAEALAATGTDKTEPEDAPAPDDNQADASA